MPETVAFLRVVEGSEAGRLVPLTQEATLIGRAAECNVVLASRTVSRTHARILQSGDEFFVEDLQSRNGVYINQHPVAQRAPLQEGDRVRVADVVFTFGRQAPSADDTRSGARSRTLATAYDEAAVESTIMPRLDTARAQDTRSGRSAGSALESRWRQCHELQRRLAQQALAGLMGPEDFWNDLLEKLAPLFPQCDELAVVLSETAGSPSRTIRRRGAASSKSAAQAVLKKFFKRDAPGRERHPEQSRQHEQAEPVSDSSADTGERSVATAPLPGGEEGSLGVLMLEAHGAVLESLDQELLSAIAEQAALAALCLRQREQLFDQQTRERDLQVARRVQEETFPAAPPSLAGLELASFLAIARDASGDFYDYLSLPDGRLAVVVADAVGRGVPAALLISYFAAGLRHRLLTTPDPARAVEQINDELVARFRDRFITLTLVVLDPHSGLGVSLCAGSHPPLLRRASGQVQPMGQESAGLPLGVVSTQYETAPFELAPGESLLLFTDGVCEVTDEGGKYFGHPRLHEAFARWTTGDAQEFIARLQSEVEGYRGDRPWPDDACAVCLKRSGRPSHALFDAQSEYSHLRAGMRLSDKLLGYFTWHRKREHPPGQEPRGVVLAVESEGAPLQRLEQARVACRLTGALSQRRLHIAVELPPEQGARCAPCRAWLVEPRVLARLRSALEENAAEAGWMEKELPQEDGELCRLVCSDGVLRSQPQVAQLLAALPELEGSVQGSRINLEAAVPDCSRLPPPTMLVLVVMGAG